MSDSGVNSDKQSSTANTVWRLLAFLKPYPKSVLGILLFVFITAVAEIMLPLVLRNTIDNYLLATYTRVDSAVLETAVDESGDKLKLALADLSEHIGDGIFIRTDRIIKINDRLLEHARQSGWLNDTNWYVFSIKNNELNNIISKNTNFFEHNGERAAFQMDNKTAISAVELQLIKGSAFQGLRNGVMQYLALLIIVLIFTFILIYESSKLAQKIMAHIRQIMLQHVMRQSLRFLGDTPVGYLVSRIANDVETINEFFTNIIISFLKDAAVMAGVILAIFALAPSLATVATLTMIPMGIIMIVFRNYIRNSFRAVRSQLSSMNAYLSEHLGGMNTIQLFGAEKRSEKEFEISSGELMNAELAQMKIMAFFRPLIDLMLSVVTALIIWYSGGLHGRGIVSLGVLIAFIALIQKFFQPIQDIAEKFNILQSAMAGAEKIFGLIDHIDQIPELSDKASVKKFRGEIIFKNIDFSYQQRQKVLKDFNLHIEAGSTVALVGTTGSGKSTIAHLLTRLWEPENGCILLDGTDIRKLPLASLRNMIQSVQQDVFLFSGPVAQNIDLGKEISQDKIIDAAIAAKAHSFINALPHGYTTNISEGATDISAGQRQLISFSRIFAFDPEVVILDEATANIDSETERLIKLSLDKLLENRTAIVIAHRLSTIQNADKIVVIGNGQVIEQGSHNELMNTGNHYSKLYKLQMKEINSEI